MSFTFSQLDAFETCPKKFHAYNVERSVKDDDTSNLDWGNAVHDAMKKYMLKGVPLAGPMSPFMKWAEKVKNGQGQQLVEQKLAIDKNLSPCGYNAQGWWYRGIVDYTRILNLAAFAVDWKTGKKKNNPTIQLALMALLLFQHYPKLEQVHTWFAWLDADDKTAQVFNRGDMQTVLQDVLPRVDKLEWAFKNHDFPPKRGFLCKNWCGVVSCPFHGKGPKDV